MRYLISAALLLAFYGCQNSKKTEETTKNEHVEQAPNATDQNFNVEESDAKAIEIAKQVVQAHGGQKAWDNSHFISWNFLGVRDLIWDKYTGNVRIEFPKENSTYLINVNKNTGRVKIGDRELTKSDSLDQYLERGKQIWVNDSYWLVFPFKFMDPGVTLNYEGRDTTITGQEAEVIQLTFEEVGFTPQNKYKAYIDPEKHLILQWDFFRNAADSVATFSNIWDDYQKYGDIYLSSGRGERSLANIKVAQKWDKTAFTEF